MSEIQQQLSEKIHELETIRKIKEHTSQLQARLSEEEGDLSLMEKTLAKEQRDVEWLEKEGLNSMFHQFLGDREQKLEKEKQEYLIASLKFNELYKSVSLIRYELDLLSKKEENLDKVIHQMTILTKKREDEIMQYEPEVAIQLKSIHQQSDKLHRYSVEVDEAINAGNQALGFVRKAEQFLIKAKNWGQQDMWARRYHRSGYMKIQAIDQAREMAYQSNHALIQFGNELKDVYSDSTLEANVNIENFGKFSSIFFESLISDWSLKQKLNTSLANVGSTRHQVEQWLRKLDQEMIKIKSKLSDLEEQRKKTILNTL